MDRTEGRSRGRSQEPSHRASWSRLALRVLSSPLEVHDEPAVADAIVVVGSPLTEAGALSGVGEERVRHGVMLWREGRAPLLVFSGGGPGRIALGIPREADAMATRAVELGVPESAIRVERDSCSTADNARNTAALLRAEQLSRVWLVTQPFHTRRTRRWFRRVGLTPLAHRMTDSLQYRDPRRGGRWVAREYAAWVEMWAWDLGLRPARWRRNK